jgi:hypothetical protein
MKLKNFGPTYGQMKFNLNQAEWIPHLENEVLGIARELMTNFGKVF